MMRRYVLSGVVAGILIIGSVLYPVTLTDTKGVQGYVASFLFNAKVYAGESDITLEDNTADSVFSIKEGTAGSTIAHFRGDGRVSFGGYFLESDGTDKVVIGTDVSWYESGTGDPDIHMWTEKVPLVTFDKYYDRTGGDARYEYREPAQMVGLDVLGSIKVGREAPPRNAYMSLLVGERPFDDNYASLWLAPSTTENRGWIMEAHDDGGSNNFWQVYDKVHDLPRLKITSDGNVGIGTTNPAYKVDVNGTIRGDNVSPSDMRWKEHVKTLDNSLEKVNKLRGVSFEWKDKTKGVGTQVGLIAQELEKVFPEVVSEDNEGYKSVAYDKLVGVLVEAIKEQQRQIEELKAEKDIETVALKALRQEISSIKEFMSTHAQAGSVPASVQVR